MILLFFQCPKYFSRVENISEVYFRGVFSECVILFKHLKHFDGEIIVCLKLILYMLHTLKKITIQYLYKKDQRNLIFTFLKINKKRS